MDNLNALFWNKKYQLHFNKKKKLRQLTNTSVLSDERFSLAQKLYFVSLVLSVVLHFV